MKYMRKLRKKAPDFKKAKKKLITFILTEDISGAFESISHEVIDEILKHCFADSSEFNIRKVVASYLKRESWVTDRVTGERRKVEKRHENKTAPQGSSLSPTLWRFFDAIFSKMYKDTLDSAVGGVITEYKHVAYADDHLTVLGLAVPEDASHEATADLVRAVTLGIRDALDTATRCAGCSINLTKSEVILADTSLAADLGAKAEFTWLGYSLKITVDHRLIFTDTKVLARFKRTLGMARSVFQYVSSMYVRWRIFRVYISPIIEWYLPVVAHKPRHELAWNNILESFQHQMLALVTGASTKASTTGLE